MSFYTILKMKETLTYAIETKMNQIMAIVR